jgi:hypothetical protein
VRTVVEVGRRSQVDGLDTYDTVKLHRNSEMYQMDRFWICVLFGGVAQLIIAIRDGKLWSWVVVVMRRFMVGGRGDGLVRGQPPSYLFRAKSLHNNVCGLGVGSHIQWISPNRQCSQSDFARLVSVK